LPALGLVVAAGGIVLAVLRGGRGLPEIVALGPELCAAAIGAWCCWQRAPAEAGRERTFWRLWAAAFALWIVNDILMILFTQGPLGSEVVYIALAFTYIPQVVMTAALVLQPEVKEGALRDPVVRYEAALVALCWVYLFLLIVTPWHAAVPNDTVFWNSFLFLHNIQNGLMIVWLAVLGIFSRGCWRRIYGHLAAATVLFSLSIEMMHSLFQQGRLVPAMIFEALQATAFLWMAWAAATQRPRPADEPMPVRPPALGSGNWLALVTAIGIPLLAIAYHGLDRSPPAVRQFRLLASLTVLIAGILLVYRWAYEADEQSERFLTRLGSSVGELRRLQGQFAEAEKLASLGQLAAGAAHEINNPVAAMLGYSELIRGDASAGDRTRELARKIGDQARRIRSLVHDLLSLAQHASVQLRPVDAAELVRSAVELRRLAAEHQETELHLEIEPGALGMRGDPDKLLQVFYGLLLALGEMVPGRSTELTARAGRQDGRVVVEFLRHPHGQAAPAAGAPERAQKAAKGTGLSLRLCDTIVREHGGTISGQNLPDGSRMFRVELPLYPAETAGAAVPALADQSS
jgi:two-component system NtrC family sensor kinase